MKAKSTQKSVPETTFDSKSKTATSAKIVRDAKKSTQETRAITRDTKTSRDVKKSARIAKKSERLAKKTAKKVAKLEHKKTSRLKKGQPSRSRAPKVIADYNGYDYKKIFWENADRKYEDAADRMAICRLLPAEMGKFADIAGGYGRLADEYLPRAKEAILFDYSKTELKQAEELYGKKLHTKAGDIYALPFKDDELDALMMVRATHHFSNMKKVTKELFRVLKPGGIAVIEVANKRTLPKMFRYWLKKSDINPFSREPSTLSNLNKSGFYNYHPSYIEGIFKDAGFEITEILSVSNFRSATLKKLFGTKNLVRLEKIVQKPLGKIRFAPSIYYRLKKPE